MKNFKFNLTLILLLACLQFPITILSMESDARQYGDGGIKISHIFILLFFGYAYEGFKKIKKLTDPGFTFLIYMMVVTLLSRGGSAIPALGLIFYSIYAYLLGWGLVSERLLTDFDVEAAVNNFVKIVYIMVGVKLLMYLSELIEGGFYGVEIPTFFSGGPNIEATWIGMFSVLSNNRYIALAFGLVIGSLYGSRAGLIAVVLSVLGVLRAMSLRKILTYTMVLITFMMLMAPLLEVVLQRFLNIADEADYEIGRVFLWTRAYELILENVFGYGVGGGISEIKNMAVDFSENNFHNIYIQMLVDGGLLGLILYSRILWVVFYQVDASIKWVKSIRVFLISYFILGFIQFTGFEIIFWIISGMYFGGKNKQLEND